jgi:hypothetical protein
MWDDSDRFCISQTVNLQVVFTFGDFRLGKDSYSFVQLIDVRMNISSEDENDCYCYCFHEFPYH